MISLFLATALAADLHDAWDAAENLGRESTLIHEARAQTDHLRFRVIASMLPSVSAAINYNINQYEVKLDFAASLPPNLAALVGDTEPIVISKKTYFDGNLTASMPIINAAGWAMARYADAAVQTGRAQERADLGNLRSGVARAYWGVLVARKAESIAENAVKLAGDFLELAERQDQAGTVAPISVLQAKLAQSRALREQQSATAGRKVAEEQFAALTGLPTDTPLTELEPRPMPYASLGDAENAALGQSPTVQAAQGQAKGATAYRNAQHLMWVPRVDARFTEMGTQNNSFNPNNWNWNAGFTLSIPIWDGGGRVASQLDAASQARQAIAMQTKAEDDARIAATKAWTERRRAEQALLAVHTEMELAQETLRVAELSFEHGESIFTELEDARLAKARAELAMIQEKMAADLAAIDLMIATGQL